MTNDERAMESGQVARLEGDAREVASGLAEVSRGETGGGRGPGRKCELPFDLRNLRRGEWWLDKIGIVLFLIGMVLMFKFTYEKGWLQSLLTPPLRIGLGMLAGTALVGIGLRAYEDRRAFAQVMLGGGIGTYYITGFAAFQMLGVFSYPVAFAFMAAVSVLAFALAVRQDEAALAVTGVSGGLATPFLLYDGAGVLGGLVIYAGLVLTGAMGIYLFKGWQFLPIVSSFGFWTVLVLGRESAVEWPGGVPSDDALVLQVGVLFGWVSLWLVPAAREALRSVNPTRWRLPEPGRISRVILEGAEAVPRYEVTARVLCFATPVVAFLLTLTIWDGDRDVAGLVALLMATGHGLAWILFRSFGDDAWIYHAQGLVAIPFATGALFLLVGGDALLVALAVEAAILHFVARRTTAKAVPVLAHVISFVVGSWLLVRLTVEGIGDLLFYYPVSYGPFGVSGFAELTALALVAASSLFVVGKRTVLVYRISAHAGLLAWLWCELSGVPGSTGDALVTVAWGVVGAGLFVAGLRRDHAYLVKAGMATLFLVVGKLILWDLAWAEPIWRVLLFLGFGGFFLVLSYYLRSLWNPRDTGEDPDAPSEFTGRREGIPGH